PVRPSGARDRTARAKVTYKPGPSRVRGRCGAVAPQRPAIRAGEARVTEGNRGGPSMFAADSQFRLTNWADPPGSAMLAFIGRARTCVVPVNAKRTMADLLQRVAANRDVEAFRMLFQTYAPRVKSYMMRQGADPNTAEELAQETLLTVWRKAAL